ncbi:hypothetical protein [Oceanobacillus sp. CF4.6]|uniref:hypothetical protein n=1 Tax=Oceanobacillus sp. CF4.6 TaxID=3373080 RepID=UPI003EE746EE
MIAIKDGSVVGHHNVEQLREGKHTNIVDWMTDICIPLWISMTLSFVSSTDSTTNFTSIP